MRYRTIDGLRGFFLIFMVVVHANVFLNALIGKLNHHYFGWVEDAQGFIFLSGLVVGMVYGSLLDKRDEAAMRGAIARRCFEVYKYHAALILIFFICAMAIPGAREIGGLRPYAEAPVSFILSSLALISASRDMGILPMYLVFFIFSPAAIVAFNRGHIAPVAVVSAGLWLLAQLGLPAMLASAIEGQAHSFGVALHIGLFFDLFAWQVVFFSGLFCGYRFSQGKLDLSFLNQRQYELAFRAALIAIFALGIFDRVVFDQWISADYSQNIKALNPRQLFTPIYLIAFAFDLFALTWLLVAGRNATSALTRRAAAVSLWFFNRPFLVFLGQHSLQVYSFHMLLTYGIEIGVHGRTVSPLLANLLIVLAVLALYVPAWLHASFGKRGRARRASPV